MVLVKDVLDDFVDNAVLVARVIDHERRCGAAGQEHAVHAARIGGHDCATVNMRYAQVHCWRLSRALTAPSLA
jgi:hypothetical protein